ncbi:hypothetical protein BKA62DRAFT_776720 [Auriculariales sp. MPI-PUGE-AT-0066]|nr:hypothetical protein BKA62DRAFT_776720 [Auriculariales sp. MPI-PUGE-AT-0066]
MAETTYEILYWPAWRAYADVARLILELGCADYTNDFIIFAESYKIKPFQRFGKTPRLTIKEEDGSVKYIWESRAINEYLAAKLGFLPHGDEYARADVMSYVHSLNELAEAMNFIGIIPNLDDRRSYWTKLHDATIPDALEYHERAVAGPFYGGTSLTLPDIVLYALVQRMRSMFSDADGWFFNASKTPKLAALVESCDKGTMGGVVRGWASARNPGWASFRFDAESMSWTIDISSVGQA